MANNRIPRNAKKIYITWKVDTTGNKAGDRATVEKTERGWILTTESGKRFYMPLALLRNADAVQVDQIETDEPNNRKDVLLSDIGTQVYIIDGASRTDKAAQAVIAALCNSGRITGELAERARNDRPTLDKIKRNLLHVQMEERETETGMRWTFYTASGVYMDISAYSRNYIRADKQGNLYPTEAPTEPETVQAVQDTTCTDTEPQRGTERATEGRGKRANYTGAALDTFERIHPTSTYIPNQLYKTAEGHLYYINTHGYMHILTGSREKSADGTKYYCIIDNLLTADNHLHESCKTFYTTAAAAREKVKEMEQTATEATESREEIEPQENTTTPETDAQRATESAKKTADDTTTTAGDTEPQRATQSHETTTSRNSITTPTEGTQEGAQTAGTSEGGNTTTTPHKEPPRAAAGGSVSQSDRRTRPAAPQSHGTTKGIQRHHRPPKTAYRAIQSAVHIPAADQRRRVAASRGSPKICIS